MPHYIGSGIKNHVSHGVNGRLSHGVRKYAPINKPVGSTLFSKRYLLVTIARVLCQGKARQKEEEKGKELFHVFVFYKFITLIVKLPEEGFTAEDE
jgi:hypothetical protein